MKENAKKLGFRAFSTFQTPKGAHKSENFAANSCKILQVRQAPRLVWSRLAKPCRRRTACEKNGHVKTCVNEGHSYNWPR